MIYVVFHMNNCSQELNVVGNLINGFDDELLGNAPTSHKSANMNKQVHWKLPSVRTYYQWTQENDPHT